MARMIAVMVATICVVLICEGSRVNGEDDCGDGRCYI